jgi:hypothetical protein
MTTSLIARPTRRYECAFIHAFDDTWDAELALGLGRLDGILAGDPEAAAEAVRVNRERIMTMTRGRIAEPRVSRYLDPSDPPS